MVNYSAFLIRQGRNEDAKVILTECLERQIALLGQSHVSVLTTQCSLAAVEAGLFNYQNSLMLYQHLLPALISVYNEKHPQVLMVKVVLDVGIIL